MQQALDFQDESRALAGLIAPLSEDDLHIQTAFKSWTIEEIVRHLHVWNQAALWSLQETPKFDEFLRAAQSGFARGLSFRAVESEQLAGLAGRALVSTWSEGIAALSRAFSAADPSARLAWVGPSMSARSSITARLMETWAHGQAVYDALNIDRVETDRIANIVQLGVNTFGWTFKNRGESAPGAMPFVRLAAPSGAEWTYGEASTSDWIEGPAVSFCQVVTQTRHIDDTTLQTHGPVARAWMEKAQCFAGPAQDPPKPGVRLKGARGGASD